MATRLAVMSRFSAEEVANVAQLARIALTEEEINRFAVELDGITSLVAKVSEVAGEDIPATSHPVPLTNVTRPDVAGVTLDLEKILAAAPAAEDNQFQVPQILEEDS